MQSIHAGDGDGVAARAFDFGAHRDQAMRQVHHFRLARRIFQNRYAVRERRGHHQVFRAGHADQIEEYARALEPFRLRVDIAVLDMDFRAHRLQAFDMQVDRTRPDGAAARQGNPRRAEARHQRPQHQNCGAHGFHHVVRRFEPVDLRRGQDHLAAVHLYRHAHLLQQLAHRGDIVQIRHIAELQRIAGQQAGTQYRQRRILGAGDAHFAVEA